MTKSAPVFAVETREIQPQQYLGKKLRAPVQAVGPAVQAGFAALYSRLSATNGQPAGPPFLVASEMPEDGYLEMEIGAPCLEPPEPGDGFESRTLPGGRVAVTVYRGPYDALGEIYAKLAEWIASHGLTMAGPPREVYLSEPGEEPVTEVVWPVQ